MGGGPDKSHGAAFDVWQEDVLLGFIEAVDFVDEEDGRLVAQLAPFLCLADFLADFGDVGLHAIEHFEAAVCGIGDDGSQGCFTGSWWAVEYEGGKSVSLDGAAQQGAFAEDVFLACDFLQRAWAHACGERGIAACLYRA